MSMKAHLVPDHIAAMTTACRNLLQQLASEGVRYRLAIEPETTNTIRVSVDDLTPDVAERIRRCLYGTGLDIDVRGERGAGRGAGA